MHKVHVNSLNVQKNILETRLYCVCSCFVVKSGQTKHSTYIYDGGENTQIPYENG